MKGELDSAFLRKIFLQLLKIPSPSRHERAIADWVVKLAGEIGYKSKEDGAAKKINGNSGNIIIKVAATDKKIPSLLIGAHLDTVGEDVVPKVALNKDTDSYHTDGSTILGGDDKCGVAVLLTLLKKLRDEPQIPHGELVFVFSVAEEVGLLGAEALDRKVYEKCVGGIILDSSSPTEIVIGAPTKVDINITVHGVGGHAAYPSDHVNAAQVLARAVGRLPSGQLDGESTANLGIAWAGTAVNVIPDTGYAEYEIRSHNDHLVDFHLANALMIIESAVREARLSQQSPDKLRPIHSKATVDVDIITQFCRYRLADNSLPVQLLMEAGKKMGVTLKSGVIPGGSDANIFNARDLPTTVYGCGWHGAHGVSEYADFKEMTACGELLFRAIQG